MCILERNKDSSCLFPSRHSFEKHFNSVFLLLPCFLSPILPHSPFFLPSYLLAKLLLPMANTVGIIKVRSDLRKSPVLPPAQSGASFGAGSQVLQVFVSSMLWRWAQMWQQSGFGANHWNPQSCFQTVSSDWAKIISLVEELWFWRSWTAKPQNHISYSTLCLSLTFLYHFTWCLDWN